MWWTNLTEECPITLEPLSSLKYPPYALVDTIDGKRHETYFDGLALATYIISQGNFTNPLTRVPLTYDDCVCLDYHLNEHIFQRGNSQAQQQHLESLGLRGDKLSVKENFLLRESIKVKTSTNETTESQLRRAEMLRNEAGVALRGLFVFGHRNQDVESLDGDAVLPQTAQSSNVALPGGFNLNHNPNNNSDDLGMSSSNYQTEGLQIIDDELLRKLSQARNDTAPMVVAAIVSVIVNYAVGYYLVNVCDWWLGAAVARSLGAAVLFPILFIGMLITDREFLIEVWSGFQVKEAITIKQMKKFLSLGVPGMLQVMFEW